LAVDNTHTKYLKGTDKKAWNDYKSAYEAQKKYESFLSGLNIPDLKEGEEYEIPTRRNTNKKKSRTKQ